MIRLATVKATGAKYVVQRLEFPLGGAAAKVHCWGELLVFSGLSSRHESVSKTFWLDDVEVQEVAKTCDLLETLLKQTIVHRRADGHVVKITRAGNATDYGKRP